MSDRGGLRQGWRRLTRPESAAPDAGTTASETARASTPPPAHAAGRATADDAAGRIAAPPAAATPARSTRRALGAFLGPGTRFEGTLSLRGDFYLDSELHGEIETDGALTVGPNGSIVGNVRAREVVIQGAVSGDVTAARLLCLAAHAKLHGDVETACLEIERNAFFQGRTTMTRPQESAVRPAPEAGPARPDAAPPAPL